MKLLSTVSRDFLAFAVIATSALGAGLFFNQLREPPLSLIYRSKADRLDDSVIKIVESQPIRELPPISTDAATPERLSLAEFRALVENGQAVIVDARPEIFHRMGHVPGAIALPRDDFEEYYRKNQRLLGKNRDQLIVVYCSGGDCEDSGLVERLPFLMVYGRNFL